MLHHVSVGLTVKQCVHQIPAITMEASIQPITRTVLRVRLVITPDFRWNDQVKVAVRSSTAHWSNIWRVLLLPAIVTETGLLEPENLVRPPDV